MTEGPNSEPQDRWVAFRSLLGSWTGDAQGEPGIGRADRVYGFVLRERYLEIRNRTIYPPQDKNPEGEVHEDLGLLSYDKHRKMYVLREFHVEGFVIHYLLDLAEVDRGRIVMTSEAIENIAPGWRARTTYHILGPDQFREEFDLAGPGKEWERYSTTEFQRGPAASNSHRAAA
jgi:hypothetical protein